MPDSLFMLPRVIAALAPHADAATWAAALTAPMQRSGLTTANRMAMFLGQVAEETAAFTLLAEDLYYTTAERIRAVWPAHFADAGEAAPFIGRPQALANHVYANRMGNGDADSGDGWRFRGRGLIQITGRALYTMFGQADPRAAGDPDWLTTPAGAAASACWYWTLPHPGHPSLNALSDVWDVVAVTGRVNGGLTGLAAREAAVRVAFATLTRTAPAVRPPLSDADRLMDAELRTMPDGSPA